MTEMIIRLDDSANSSLIKKMFMNIRGVVDISIKKIKTKDSKEERKASIHKLSNSIDKSYIDLEDEKTLYILSK